MHAGSRQNLWRSLPESLFGKAIQDCLIGSPVFERYVAGAAHVSVCLASCRPHNRRGHINMTIYGRLPRKAIFLVSAAGMHESIRPVAGLFAPLALMGVRCF
jgi:hypothetical protein